MKGQWRSISAEQEERFSAFRERKTQIEKDVSRTDRTHPFFAGDGNRNVELLQDILMTFIMYDFDLGYVQVIKVISIHLNDFDNFCYGKLLIFAILATETLYRECQICYHHFFMSWKMRSIHFGALLGS